MFPHSSHISRKRGVYYYRRRLPVPYEGEIALSLRNRTFREAEHLAIVLDRSFIKFFKGSPGMAKVKKILRQRLRDALEADLAQHLRTPSGRPVYGQHYRDVDPPVIAIVFGEIIACGGVFAQWAMRHFNG